MSDSKVILAADRFRKPAEPVKAEPAPPKLKAMPPACARWLAALRRHS